MGEPPAQRQVSLFRDMGKGILAEAPGVKGLSNGIEKLQIANCRHTRIETTDKRRSSSEFCL